MTDTKRPNADGQGRDTVPPQDQSGDFAARAESPGRGGGGDSGGGAYPNPHSGKDGSGDRGFMGHGGQSEMAYHGKGQLGSKTVEENPNSAATEE